jgi:hypothetical protein
MKLLRLLEADQLKPTVMRLQRELLEVFHPLIEDITLEIGKDRANIYDRAVSMKLEGPLVEFFIDIYHHHNDDYYTLAARTDQDEIGDSLVVIHDYNVSKFTHERVIKLISNLNNSSFGDVVRYKHLWFDKISRSLPSNYKLLIKTQPLAAAQIIKTQIYNTDRQNDEYVSLVLWHLHNAKYEITVNDEHVDTMENVLDALRKNG